MESNSFRPAVDIPVPHYTWPLLDDDDETAVLRQRRSGEFSCYRRGGIVSEFGDAFAALLDVPYVMSTHSGTGALHAVFFARGLAPGDEVLAALTAPLPDSQVLTVNIGMGQERTIRQIAGLLKNIDSSIAIEFDARVPPGPVAAALAAAGSR